MSDALLKNIAAEREQIKAKKQHYALESAKLDARMRELDVIEIYVIENSMDTESTESGFFSVNDNSVRPAKSSLLPASRRVRLGVEKRKVFEVIRDKPLTKLEIEQETLLDPRSVRGVLRDGAIKGDVFSKEDRYGLTDVGIALLDAVVKRDNQAPLPNEEDTAA